ncbi:Isochorismatase-like protein [Podospora appendiculata]|uniref:Isochorismatase-like protein n=1 Tax=Podospora appendiculata TaxID=314037 RepID=A0AAE0XC50_9PEZI|nr:Isochorismatase-like protein [Podospora appendiculata]
MTSGVALFVIDIQNYLAADAATQIPHADRIRATGTKILLTARGIVDRNCTQSPFRIVFVQHEQLPGDGPLIKGTQPWKLVFEPREGVREETLVAKSTRDAFESNPDFASQLKSMDITDIIAFGIQSECCVESTCGGALAAGFGVTVLGGAHSTYDDGGMSAVDIEREVEGRLAEKGARVVPWEEAVGLWERMERLDFWT